MKSDTLSLFNSTSVLEMFQCFPILVADIFRMLRVNVKLLLFIVSCVVFLATWSLWNKCLDALHSPGWENYKHIGDGPLQVSAN